MQATVEAYDPAFGMLDLALGGNRYRVRLANAVAQREPCNARTLLVRGRMVEVTVAAYLDGPLIATSVSPAAGAATSTCFTA